MSTSAEFTDYVLDQLAGVGIVHTSRMFGGVLLKVDNKQLGVIIADILYFKVKEHELKERFEKMGSESFSYTRKDTKESVVVKNWLSVPEEILEDKKQLVGLAYEILLQGS